LLGFAFVVTRGIQVLIGAQALLSLSRSLGLMLCSQPQLPSATPCALVL
jgi:hypothetical protein